MRRVVFPLVLLIMVVAVAGVEAEREVPSFEVVSCIRERVSREVDWGTKSTQLAPGRLFKNSAKLLHKIFVNDDGAVTCQGAAYYLHLIYLEKGYRSFLVGFSNPRLGWSHATTLVEVVRKDGSRVLTIQDPTFNISYVKSTGQVLSIFEVLRMLERGEQCQIKLIGTPPVVDYLVDPRDIFNDLSSVIIIDKKVRKFKGVIKLSNAVQNYKAGSPFNLLFGPKLLYVYKRYPMTHEEKREAEALAKKIKSYLKRIKFPINGCKKQ